MSEKQIALIRGINVGKAKRVAMADLRALIEDLGCKDVKTLLNSGNVVFTSSEENTVKMAVKIEGALYNRTGISAKVIVISGEELKEIVKENSLLDNMEDPSRLLVAFVQDNSELEKLKSLEAQKWGDEALVIGSRAAYLWCPEGILASKLPIALGSIMGESITTRNWATVMKLHGLIS